MSECKSFKAILRVQQVLMGGDYKEKGLISKSVCAFKLQKDKHLTHTSIYKSLIFKEREAVTALYQYRCIVLIRVEELSLYKRIIIPHISVGIIANYAEVLLEMYLLKCQKKNWSIMKKMWRQEIFSLDRTRAEKHLKKTPNAFSV